MFKSGSKWPARTRRNLLINKAKTSFEQYAIWAAGDSEVGGSGMNLGFNGQVPVWVAGRIIGILDDGFVLQDESGRMDVMVRGDEVLVGGWKIGDIVEVRIERELSESLEGIGMIDDNLSGQGQKSLHAQTFGGDKCLYIAKEVKVLASCQTDFFIKKGSPNYLKAVIDVNLREKLRMRTLVVNKIRDFFVKEGFMDVETPELVSLPGMEPHLDVFKTTFRSWQARGKNGQVGGAQANTSEGAQDMYLITSPEYAMKKLLVAGYEKVFQICKSFRNKEDVSLLHNPEFTILEWYRSFASYEEIMTDTEKLVGFLCSEFRGVQELEFNGHKVDVSGIWERKKVKDLFAEMAGIPVADFEDVERFREAVKSKGYKVDQSTLYEDLFFEVFLNEIEPKLGLKKPVIVYEYPVSMAALSKRCEDDPRYAERFEVYIAGLELCNAFTELNDPSEQKARLEVEREERKKLGKEQYDIDDTFIEALRFGMPPAGGVALGVDRLAMLILGIEDINDALFFPHRDL